MLKLTSLRKNAQFVELVNATAKAIAEGKPANNEEALALTMPSGETLEAAYVSATATIGEKNLIPSLLL